MELGIRLVADLRPDSTPEDHKILPHIWERKDSNIRETDIFNIKKKSGNVGQRAFLGGKKNLWTTQILSGGPTV